MNSNSNKDSTPSSNPDSRNMSDLNKKVYQSWVTNLFNQFPVMMLRYSEDGIIQNANKRFVLETGIQIENAIGRKINEIVLFSNDESKLTFDDILKKESIEIPAQISCDKEFYILFSTSRLPSEINVGGDFLAVLTNVTSHVISEQKLKKSEREYRLYHESTNDIIWTINLKGKLDYVSPSVEKFLGYTPEEHLRQSFSDFLTQDSCELVMQMISTLFKEIAEGKPAESDKQKILEVEYIRKDGTHGYGEVRANPTRDDNGIPIGINGITTDITERKVAEIKLIDREEKYRLMIENTSELLVRLDLDGTVTFVSSSFCEKFEMDEALVLGKKFIDILNDRADCKGFEKVFSNLMFSPYSEYIEHKTLSSFGNCWIAWSFKTIIDEKNELVAFVGVGRDITNNKQAEISLRESEKRYRTISETVISGILIVNKQDQVAYANNAFCNLLGYVHEEIIGKSIRDFIPSDSLEYYDKETYGRHDGNHSIYETKMMNVNGKEINVLISASPLLDENGELIETIAVISDIGILKETEEKLIEADRLKSAFLANMSHEIRNPMNGIIGFADLLRFPDLSEEQKNEYIDHITNSCNILLNLIEDIIDISKIEAGQLVIKESETFINELFYRLKKQFSEKMIYDGKENISLVMHPGRIESNFKVVTDSYRLNQILSNLLENAIKFTKEGTIEFGYTIENENTIRFYVSDTGIGLPKDKLNMIFDRFRQVDEDTAIRKFGGAGLGLSISRSLTELLGGKMWVVSELDKGSIFYFTLPLKSPDFSKDEYNEERNVVGKYNWKGKTILIAEDEDTNFIFLQKLLQKTEVSIVWAKDGREAIDAVSRNKNIDLVLLDIKMPRVSGYEAVVEIKKSRPKLPVIAQTAYAMLSEKDKSIKLGCDDYITKPINPEKLMLSISNYFDPQS